jgi:hypothetical protein
MSDRVLSCLVDPTDVALWHEHDAARQDAQRTPAWPDCWRSSAIYFCRRKFMPRDAERLRGINERLVEIGMLVAGALPVADLRAKSVSGSRPDRFTHLPVRLLVTGIAAIAQRAAEQID